MAIRIARNDAGNCINFFGSSNPTYWNAVLEGRVNEDNPNNVDVINTVRTLEQADTVYEFFNLPYTDFVDKDENTFENASECAQYITDNANVLSNQGTFVFSQSDVLDAQRESTNTTVLFSNGDIFAVNSLHANAADNGTITVKTIEGDRTIYQNLRHYNFTVNSGTLSFNTLEAAVNRLNEVLLGQTIITDPGTLSQNPNVNSSNGNWTIYGDRITQNGPIYSSTREDGNFDTSNGMYSNETISDPGSYFEWSQIGNFDNAGTGFTVGLFDETTYDTSVLEIDELGNAVKNIIRLRLKNTPFIFSDPASAYGKINEIGFNSDPVSKLTYRMGIDVDSRAYISYIDPTSGLEVVIGRTETSLVEDTELRLNVIMPLANELNNIGNFTVNTAIQELALAYYYIESPDGNFEYPLFSTEEEALAYDELTVGTGNGTTSINSYIDQTPTVQQWYMPGDTANRFNNETSAPDGIKHGGKFDGVIWNEITTGSDTNYVPSVFNQSLTVDENSYVNLQIIPTGSNVAYSVTNLPPGLVFSNGYIIGNAPDVLQDNVTNPSDVYSIAVTRANEFGSSVGSLELTVTNLNAPVINPITGFDFVGGTALVADDIISSGSVVKFTETIHDGERLVIDKEWIDANVLPAITPGSGSKVVRIGFAVPGTDWSSISPNDFYLHYEFYSDDTTRANNNWKLKPYRSTTLMNNVGIGGQTSGLYDYVFINKGGEVKIGGLVASQGHDASTYQYDNSDSNWNWDYTQSTGVIGDKSVFIAVEDTQMSLSTSNVAEYNEPLPNGYIQIEDTGSNVYEFNGGSFPTLQAGYTYTFLINDVFWSGQDLTNLSSNDQIKFTADGSTEYITGITVVGAAGDSGADAYVQFVVPSDVPPLSWYTDAIGIGNAYSISISGSTYVETVTGITQEGPVANQTGTNLFDASDHGWLSINETLSAGERLILNNTFLYDLVNAMPDDSDMYIGLKSDTWTDTYSANFKGGTYIYIARYDVNNIRFRLYSNGTYTSMWSTSLTNVQYFAFILEVTNSGNNVRVAIQHNTSFPYDTASTAYADWGTALKLQTGDQGYGITSLDIMVLGSGNLAGNLEGMDSADVDWTELSEIPVPNAAVTNLTSWTKALDFSGGSEYAKQVAGNEPIFKPLNMSPGVTTSDPLQSGYTTASSSGRPFATAVVFKIDGNNSNQHIWNYGEGAGSTDDNIYLRTDSAQNLYFGWGRSGAMNEVRIITAMSSAFWYGVYIAHNGRRRPGSGAHAGNLSNDFQIKYMTGHDNFATMYTGGSYNDWNAPTATTGGRQDREITGDFTIGGRSSNRNLHGKVASMVVTTLKLNSPMPTVTEIHKMITDPVKWVADYKIGNDYRVSSGSQNFTNFQLVTHNSGTYTAGATQVWLMGDGSSDSYANGIRNYIQPGDQSYTKLQLNSMVSNDIETVSIGGLS